MGFLKHDWPFLLPCDLCTVCANGYAFGRVCLCVCATKKHPFTHLPVSIFTKIVYATHLHCVCHQICLLDLLSLIESTIPNISIHVIPLSPGLLEVLLW